MRFNISVFLFNFFKHTLEWAHYAVVPHIFYKGKFKFNTNWNNDWMSKVGHPIRQALIFVGIWSFLFCLYGEASVAICVRALIYTMLFGWGWEIFDGFKPLYVKGKGRNILIRHLVYADGFSYSDLVYNLKGEILIFVIFLFASSV